MSKQTERAERQRKIREWVQGPEMQPVFGSWMLGYDDGLEWAADWLLSTAKGDPDARVREFASNMAMSIRAHKIMRL